MLSKLVSVVICVKNVEDIIFDCIKSVETNSPKEIIIVDGCSTDNTVKIAKKFSVIVLSDNRRGLSYARRIGAKKANGKYVLFIGPDNILKENFVYDFVKILEDSNFDAATTRTRVKDPFTYWDKGLDLRWKFLTNNVGPRKIIGTPGLYKMKCFKKVQFSKKDFGPCDDTYFCEKLLKAGFSIGLVSITIYDQNNSSFKSTWNRFKWYGTGDYQFFTHNMSNWSFFRKIKSILHPFDQFLKDSFKAFLTLNFIYLPWNVTVMLARYYGWFSKLFYNNKKSKD